MSHIFISYSRDDLAFARYLRALLIQEGFAVWMDERGLSAGMNWWKEIERNIDSCAAFLVIMSPSSDESMYVHNEILRALDQKKPLFPVLVAGQPFSLLASVQYEDLRAGLNAKLSQEFLGNLHRVCTVVPRERSVRFEIVEGDVRDIACDVLILKYAQGFHGADSQVYSRLRKVGNVSLDLEALFPVGGHQLVGTNASILAQQALFIGTTNVFRFGYRQIREFAEQSFHILADDAPNAKHLAMTVHGVKSGMRLDEGETLLAQLGGIVDALQSWNVPYDLERISIVEIDPERVRRLRAAVTPYFEEVAYAQPAEGETWGYDLHFQQQMVEVTPDAGTEAVKPYALVMLPDDPSLEDIYYYGIERPVHAQGLLCERAPLMQEVQEADEIQESLARAGSATLLICHLAQVTPLLTLHLGYAWGKGVPVVLVGQASEEASFYQQEVLHYEKIWELEERLMQKLNGLEL